LLRDLSASYDKLPIAYGFQTEQFLRGFYERLNGIFNTQFATSMAVDEAKLPARPRMLTVCAGAEFLRPG